VTLTARSAPTRRVHRLDDVAALGDVRRRLEQEPIERGLLALAERIELDAGLPPPAVIVPDHPAGQRDAVNGRSKLEDHAIADLERSGATQPGPVVRQVADDDWSPVIAMA